MKPKRPAIHFWIAALTLGALIWTVPLGAQSPSYTPQDRDSDMSRQQGYPQQDRDNDMSRRQLANFDRFLDSHPELAEQIRKDPTLVNNEEFVENHRDLQQYLQQHPEVREQLRQNPNAVMHQEQRYDRREDRMQDRDRDMNRDQDRTQDRDRDMNRDQDRTPDRDRDMNRDQDRMPDRDRNMSRDQNRNRDITRGELSNLDNFMDSHPEIAEQLKKDPSLVNDKKFVEGHPALKGFLAADPGVRQEMQENPNGFMAREQRFDQTDANSRELGNMDRFMDTHPEIAEQLRKNPALVNDKKFVENHKALKTFLATHPYAAQEYKEHPSAFMQQEQNYEHQQQNFATRRDQDFGTRRDQDYGMRAGTHGTGSHGVGNQGVGNQGVTGDRDRMGGSVSSFNEFLEHHGNIASDLSKNPSLATNEEYVENHPALRQYLQANPQVRQQLSANPQAFVKSAPTSTAAPKGSPKLPSDPKLK